MLRNIAALTLAGAATASKDTCRVLVLSGGGSNGAWEAGVMWGLVNYGNPADFEWDVVSGVSAGSINALAMSGYPVGQEAEMAQWLSDEWKNLKTEDVWVDWPWGGKTKGLTLEPGIVDNSPLLTFL